MNCLERRKFVQETKLLSRSIVPFHIHLADVTRFSRAFELLKRQAEIWLLAIRSPCYVLLH